LIAATKARWTRGTVHSLARDYYTDPHVRQDHEGYINGNIGLYSYRWTSCAGWHVQHHPSGWNIGTFKRKRDAQEAIATLRAEFDFAMLDRFAIGQQEPQDWDDGPAFRKRFHELRNAADAR
jgi:hypothetical protein